MALLSKNKNLTTSYQTLHTGTAGNQTTVHSLTFTNNTAATVTFDLTFFSVADNATYQLATTQPVSAYRTYTWAKPINMAAGDYIQAKASSNSAVVTNVSYYENTTTVTGFTIKGTWNSALGYSVNDIVFYAGVSYAAIQASTNQNPSTATTYWQKFSDTGASGATGVQGASGSTGPTGATGFGATGASGATGVQGASGSTGPTGATGFGATGATGVQGASGASGSTGLTGATGFGATGATGVQGASGASGATGFQGASGASGSTGPTGATGIQGASGATGIQGASGATGIGYTALTSTTSFLIGTGSKTFTVNLNTANSAFAVGQRVRVISTVTSTNFMEGLITAYTTTSLTVNVDYIGGSGTLASWSIVVIGSPGATGATGFQGASGATGIQGASGATGIQGASGSTGIQGASGATGIQGASGATGFQGASGATGIQGASGATGIQGASGSTGIQGASGATGFQGASGATGFQGASGSTGPTGAVTSPRVSTFTSTGATGATGVLTPNSTNFDLYDVTSLTNTLTIANDIGAPSNGQKLIFRISDNGTQRAIFWSGATGATGFFRPIGVNLPSQTTAGKRLTIGCIYNSNFFDWGVIAVAQEV